MRRRHRRDLAFAFGVRDADAGGLTREKDEGLLWRAKKESASAGLRVHTEAQTLVPTRTDPSLTKGETTVKAVTEAAPPERGAVMGNYGHGESRYGELLKEYVYTDKDGNPYHKVERRKNLVEGEKDQFPQYHWVKNSKTGKCYWKPNAPKGPKMPYFLLDLLKDEYKKEPALIAEGEKDVETLIDLGFKVVTTNPGGARKWPDYFKDYFVGREEVWIFEDNDKPGYEHVLMVANNLKGIVTKIRIVKFRDLPETKDVSYWVELTGGTKETLLKRVMAAPLVGDENRKEIVLVCAADIIPRAKDWLWEGHLLRGGLELFTGIPGLGKSQVQCYFVACATAERKWPNGAASVPPMNVIMVTAEDALDQEVVPRLIAVGANPQRVHILKCLKMDKQQRQFLLTEDLDELERAVTKLGGVGLITIDPITAYMGGKLDSHKVTDVRSQLGPLKDFAERVNIAVSAVTHPAKNAGSRAIDHFIGSQAFIAAARIGHASFQEMGEDGIPTNRILFTNPKNNPSPKMPTLAYRMEQIVIGQDQSTGKTIAVPHIVWADQPVDISADAAIAANKPPDSAQVEVRKFLLNMLADGKPKLEAEIKDAASQQGFTPKQLKTAKARLKIVSEKAKDMAHGPWYWRWVPPGAL